MLVNNAGVSATGNILDASADSVDAMVDVNLRAVLHLCRLLMPGMVERDLGHIVNISSIAGLYNFYGHTVYHATKAAVHQISRQLRNDTIGKRIRVTEICPGRVETEIFGRNLGGIAGGDEGSVGDVLRRLRVPHDQGHRRHHRVRDRRAPATSTSA